MKQPMFLNPFTDFGFKKIFGNEQNKEILIDFLNDILEHEDIIIKDLAFKPTEKLPFNEIDRKAIFDISCEHINGEKFTIELQNAHQDFFKDRLLYYSSFSIQEQAIKGEWNYELKPIYVIAIMNFSLDNLDENRVLSTVKFMDIERKVIYSNLLTFITIELKNFTKKLEDLETNIDKWLYLIKNLYNFEEIPNTLKINKFMKFLDTAQYNALSFQEKKVYEESLKIYNDNRNTLNYAIKTGYNEGLEDGRIEGKLEGIKEGKLDLIKIALKNNPNEQEIAQLLGISIDEIQQIKKNL